MTLFEQAVKETLESNSDNKEYLLGFRFLCAVRKVTNNELHDDTEVNFHHDLYLEANDMIPSIKRAKGE